LVVYPTAGIGLAVLGGFVCFLGYRMLRAVLGIAGFMLGALGATWFAGEVLHLVRTWLLVAVIAGGIIGAVLAAFIYKLGVFLLGAAGGALAALTLAPGPRPLVVLAVAVGSGVLALLLQRAVLTLVTAFAGAWAAVAGVSHLAGWLELPVRFEHIRLTFGPGQRGMVTLAAWLVLGAVGTIIQLSAGKPRKQD